LKVFTGIITHLGEITKRDLTDGGLRLKVKVDFSMDDVALGASISHAGCCLTVVSMKKHSYEVEISHETLSLTTLGDWQEGDFVNLERALKIGDELGGHIVSGHVDGVCTLTDLVADGDSYRLKFKVPRPLERFIAPKGSVAIDGISLTINEVEDDQFGVNIIPHTWTHTTLGKAKVGQTFNLEVDKMARYAARWFETAVK
jgi:riboflavin synthase